MTAHFLRAGAVLLWLVVVVPSAWGHTAVTSIKPASGSVLKSVPQIVEINFREPARLTSVLVLAADKTEHTLTFEPSGSSASFQINTTQLTRGRNEIRWKALSADGHVISGAIILVIEPAS